MKTTTPKQAFADVLCGRTHALAAEGGAPAHPDLEPCADRAQLVGLALSGGGIRSATFALGRHPGAGKTQAFARVRLSVDGVGRATSVRGCRR